MITHACGIRNDILVRGVIRRTNPGKGTHPDILLPPSPPFLGTGMHRRRGKGIVCRAASLHGRLCRRLGRFGAGKVVDDVAQFSLLERGRSFGSRVACGGEFAADREFGVGGFGDAFGSCEFGAGGFLFGRFGGSHACNVRCLGLSYDEENGDGRRRMG